MKSVAASSWDTVRMRGGFVPPGYAEDVIGEPIPELCRGGPDSVWLVGEITRS
jgi:hypothetical protein